MDNYGNNGLSTNDNSVLNELSADVGRHDEDKSDSKHHSPGSFEHVIADKIKTAAEKIEDPVLREVLKDFSLVLDLTKTDLIDSIKAIDKELSGRIDGYDEAKTKMLEKIPDSIKDPVSKTLSAIDKVHDFSKMSLPDALSEISKLIEDKRENVIEADKNDVEKENDKIEINTGDPIEPNELNKLQDNLKDIENDNNLIDNGTEDIIDAQTPDLSTNEPTASDISSNEVDINTPDIDDKNIFDNQEDLQNDSSVDNETSGEDKASSDYSEVSFTDDSTIAETKVDHSEEDPDENEPGSIDANDTDSFDKYEKPERLDEPENELERKDTEDNANITDEALEFDKIDDVPVTSNTEQMEIPENDNFNTDQIENNSREELSKVDNSTDHLEVPETNAYDTDGDGTVNEQDEIESVVQNDDVHADVTPDVQTEELSLEDDLDQNDVETRLDNDIMENTSKIAENDSQIDQNEVGQTDNETQPTIDTDKAEISDTTTGDALENNVDNIGNSLDELSRDWNDSSFQEQETFNNDFENDIHDTNDISTATSAENELENLKETEVVNVGDSIENEIPEDIINDSIDFEIPQGIDDTGLENIPFEDPYENIQNISDTIDFASEFADDVILPETDNVDLGVDNDGYDLEIPENGSDVYIGDLAEVDFEEIAELLI